MKTTKTVVKEETEMSQPNDSPETKIAVINNDIKHINTTLVRMESTLNNAITGFVTYEKLADAQKAADEKHREQDKAIAKLEGWNMWAVRIVGGAIIIAILGLILTNKTPL